MFGSSQNPENELQEKARKKVKEGWIRATMFIEVLVLNERDAKESLEEHIEKMKKEGEVIIYKIDFKGIQQIKNPLQGVEIGYSDIVEIELVVQNLDRLVYLAMNYGPTNIEIIEPANITIPAGEAQTIVNTAADMIHKFLSVTKFGGIPIKRKDAAEGQ